MIYHSSQNSFYGAYKGMEILGSTLFSTAKQHPYVASILVIGAIASYHLFQNKHLKDEIQYSFQSLKFAVRQMIC